MVTMPHQINYKESYNYSSSKGGIAIPVILIIGEQVIDGWAKIDTGAEFCLFERGYADRLGLDVETGHQIQMHTLTDSFSAFGHEITLVTLNLAFTSIVYFAEDYAVSRSVLGRNGWLQQVRLGLCDYDEMLYVSAYDEI
jgi:hypothetical protein